MATELKTLLLLIDADARLAAAAGAAARFLADAAGLEPEATASLQASVVSVCLESFDRLEDSRACIEVTLARFPDRIEVALSSRGKSAPAFGLDTIAGFAKHASGNQSAPGVFAGVDRVQYETHEGGAVTRLTKYFGQLAPRL